MFLKLVTNGAIKPPFTVSNRGRSWLFDRVAGLPSKALPAQSVCVEDFPAEYGGALLQKYKGSMVTASDDEVKAMNVLLKNAPAGIPLRPAVKLAPKDVLVGSVTVEDFDGFRADEVTEFLTENVTDLAPGVLQLLADHVREDRNAPKTLEAIEAFLKTQPPAVEP